MRVPVGELIDGVMRALREDVLPEIASARARGRLWAALDVLNNLRDRVEPATWLARAEVDSARDALDACAAALRAAHRERQADAVAGLADAALSDKSTDAERALALRTAVVAALRSLADGDDGATRSARAALESHLASQALRDVMALKPSLLIEISKG
jgi:hypothetical protein